MIGIAILINDIGSLRRRNENFELGVALSSKVVLGYNYKNKFLPHCFNLMINLGNGEIDREMVICYNEL